VLAAVHAESSRLARNCAVLADPSWQALTLASDVMAIPTIPAGAIALAILAVSSEGTRVFARDADVTGRTNILPGDMIAGFIT
jgi:hypothetical protein